MTAVTGARAVRVTVSEGMTPPKNWTQTQLAHDGPDGWFPKGPAITVDVGGGSVWQQGPCAFTSNGYRIPRGADLTAYGRTVLGAIVGVK